MSLDQTRANEILTWMHGGAQPAALTTPIRIRLLTAIGNATTNGTEVATGGGYTAPAASGSTGGISTSWAAASAGSQATNAVAQTTNYPRVETVTSIELVDSNVTAIKRVEFGALTTSRAMAAGDTLSFASGAITSALA
jgi:hypothetical protein